MITDIVFFPEAITRFVWVLLLGLGWVVACLLLWIVGGFIVERVEAACYGPPKVVRRRRRGTE